MNGPLVLAIESATSCVGCALGTPAGVLASTHSTRGRHHAESLAPQIQQVVAEAGAVIADIEMIAVDVGPGLYTGLRVGITTARAMAHTLSVPMLAVTSVEAIAHANRNSGALTVAIDARRGEVFHSTFVFDSTGAMTGSEPGVATADQVDTRESTIVVGDGALVYAESFARLGLTVDVDAVHLPMPEAVLELAVSRLDKAVDPTAIEPLYLRRPDAVAKWEGAAR